MESKLDSAERLLQEVLSQERNAERNKQSIVASAFKGSKFNGKSCRRIGEMVF